MNLNFLICDNNPLTLAWAAYHAGHLRQRCGRRWIKMHRLRPVPAFMRKALPIFMQQIINRLFRRPFPAQTVSEKNNITAAGGPVLLFTGDMEPEDLEKYPGIYEIVSQLSCGAPILVLATREIRDDTKYPHWISATLHAGEFETLAAMTEAMAGGLGPVPKPNSRHTRDFLKLKDSSIPSSPDNDYESCPYFPRPAWDLTEDNDTALVIASYKCRPDAALPGRIICRAIPDIAEEIKWLTRLFNPCKIRLYDIVSETCSSRRQELVSLLAEAGLQHKCKFYPGR